MFQSLNWLRIFRIIQKDLSTRVIRILVRKNIADYPVIPKKLELMAQRTDEFTTRP